MKELLFNLSYYGFKLYVCDYVLFVRFFNVFAMQSNQWCSCNVFINANIQLRFHIFLHNDT